ncbi:hypothetical protein PIROE2DRAFT_61589 [Piromyces sp. E2]|nr:hypothetical protein PIROE2DRAFT_61589 [Piromyces sp. E2]|eukprot:OUM62925.1 hypothetical protein PIROE2DRAFT_61589 [Piromyces sp. E2]
MSVQEQSSQDKTDKEESTSPTKSRLKSIAKSPSFYSKPVISYSVSTKEVESPITSMPTSPIMVNGGPIPNNNFGINIQIVALLFSTKVLKVGVGICKYLFSMKLGKKTLLLLPSKNTAGDAVLFRYD